MVSNTSRNGGAVMMIGLNRRRTMGNILPYDAEVEYIETQQGSYIDTGIKASSNLQIKTKIFDYFNNTSLFGRWPFGGRNGYNNNAFGLFIDASVQKLYCAFGSTTHIFNSYSSYPNTAEVEMRGGFLKVGNVTHTFSYPTFISSYTLYLGRLNNGGTSVGGRGIKLGETYVTDRTTTLDMIPVRKNGIGYMYDRITGRLIGSGGVDFLYGPDK